MKVLIYDGDCNMCSRLIQFVVFINKDKDLYITDFNSQWTKNNSDFVPEIESLVFVNDSQVSVYSEAVIELSIALHPLLKPIKLGYLIPKKLRDGLYKIIAKNRHKFFKQDACKLANEKFKTMYLN